MLLMKVTKEWKNLLPWKRANDSVQRQHEILHLKQRLETYDIQFPNLAYRPSDVETQTLMEISKTVALNNELLKQLSSEKELAVELSLAHRVGTTLQILQDHLTFIVAMAHIFSGPYPSLRAYISHTI
ncbi:hypothetical protein HZF08_05160 [Paenibacillus sp. CGMCC 1.16610]|uniref:Uncharacterized protein n=1 Tax=Paenibacillus anseongense TaxID=2682845 RepID=A0ABW9UBH0_9BACL|nr:MULTISPECIES: hypothetical protein [Paenibacillus]MBA2937684.1 hypothetical protein [Paenibacillus sp. CGMCC 1.16610]MVQ36742.1 hypothetical protein [Paenibacillus anseongense]